MALHLYQKILVINRCLLVLLIFLPCILRASNHLTTSVIIPCYWGHFKCLSELLDVLCKQTVLPDEVVISLSEIEKLNTRAIQQFEEKIYPFPVKIIKHKERLFAGANRNSACKNASGDIFILNDADDLPHIQRIEMIRHVFENTDAQMVAHYYSAKSRYI